MTAEVLDFRAQVSLQKVPAKVIDGKLKIGYARVSSDDQNIEMQIDDLERAGCETIYKDDGVSGVKHRPALRKALKDLKPGDTFVFWKLDRLGRGALDLLAMLQDFEKRGINLKSLTEPIDTNSAMGKAFSGIAAVFSQLFREISKENQRARHRGRQASGKTSRPPTEVNARADALRAIPDHRRQDTYNSVATIFNVDATTVWRALKRQQC